MYKKFKAVQEISDDFDDKFGKLIGDQKLTYEIIEWWYKMIRNQMEYAEEIGRILERNEIIKLLNERK